MSSTSIRRMSAVSRLVKSAKNALFTRCAIYLGENTSQASLIVHCDREEPYYYVHPAVSCDGFWTTAPYGDESVPPVVGLIEDNDSADFHLLVPSEPAESVRSCSPAPSTASGIDSPSGGSDESDNNSEDNLPALVLDRDNSASMSSSEISYGLYSARSSCDSLSSLKVECGDDDKETFEDTLPALPEVEEGVSLGDALAALNWLQRYEGTIWVTKDSMLRECFPRCLTRQSKINKSPRHRQSGSGNSVRLRGNRGTFLFCHALSLFVTMANATYYATVMSAYAYPYTYTYVDPSVPPHTYTEWSPPDGAYDDHELEILESLFPDAFEHDAPDMIHSPSGMEYEWSDEFNDYVPVPVTPAPAPFAFKPPTGAFVPRHLRQLPTEDPQPGEMAWLHLMRLLERFAMDQACRWRDYDAERVYEEIQHEIVAPPPTPGPSVVPPWSVHVAAIWGHFIDESRPPPGLFGSASTSRLGPFLAPADTHDAPPAADCATPAASETPLAPSWKRPTFEDMLTDMRPAESHREPPARHTRQSDAVLLHPIPQRWDSTGSASSASSPSGFWSATDRASSASSAPSARSYKMSPGPDLITFGASLTLYTFRPKLPDAGPRSSVSRTYTDAVWNWRSCIGKALCYRHPPGEVQIIATNQWPDKTPGRRAPGYFDQTEPMDLRQKSAMHPDYESSFGKVYGGGASISRAIST
ncbi:hypothetical protein AURDEDRAFT_123350 [Auricularia subglabra TFB-10046 SS5]|nr:hypothetical protein AURDEDRAFT_123350 [Auricularia subglabra TFB-10046 SS5]